MKHLDPGAVDRIIAAVDAAADIDRQELLADIENQFAIYRTGAVLRLRPVDREQMLAKIAEGIERNRDLLRDYIYKYGMLHLNPNVALLNRALEELSKEDSPTLNRIVGFKQSTTISAVERLVLGLAEAFERHWGIKAGYTDSHIESISCGPSVDFIDAVLQEAGIHYDRPSITRTIRKLL